MIMTIARITLFLSIALIPVYLWPSGGMQLMHIMLGIYMLGYILLYGFHNSIFNTLLLLLLLFMYTKDSAFIINNGLVSTLMPSLYLMYNICVVNIIRRAALQKNESEIIKWGVVTALIVTVLALFVNGFGVENSVRSVGSFNNPNQLGYFSVCAISIALLFRVGNNLSVLSLISVSILSFIIAIFSLSKAAIISVIVAIIFSFFTYFKTRRSKIIIGSMIITVVVFMVFTMYSDGYLDNYSFVKRLENIGLQSDDSFSGRGYLDIFNGTVLEIVTGRDSAVVRQIIGHEVHSTIFSFLVNYGLIGGGLILAILFLWSLALYRSFGLLSVILVVAPTMLYGLSHNGSRFTMFWILIALSFAIVDRKNKTIYKVKRNFRKFPNALEDV